MSEHLEWKIICDRSEPMRDRAGQLCFISKYDLNECQEFLEKHDEVGIESKVPIGTLHAMWHSHGWGVVNAYFDMCQTARIKGPLSQ